MNILEAMERGLVKGEKIKRVDGEWIAICTNGTAMRFTANRQVYHPSVADIVATDWIAENDFVSVSNFQVEEVLTSIGVSSVDQKTVLRQLGFAVDGV
jgi:hypothetical protein